MSGRGLYTGAFWLLCCSLAACSSNPPSMDTNPVQTSGNSAKPGSSNTSTAGATAGTKSNTSTTTATAGATAGMGTTQAGGKSGSSAEAGKSAAGSAGTSQAGNTAGGAGAAGMSSMKDEDDAGVMECKPLERPLNVGGYPKCSKELCPAQDSVCVQNTLLKDLKIPESTTTMLADCDTTSKCVPVSLAQQAGHAILTTCTSLIGAEGRCVSTCVPQVTRQATQLPKDVCTGTDLCAPCYDPRTGESTGACSQGCDKGPTKPAKTFAHCCSNRGLCVPPSLAGSQAPNLNKDTCGQDLLCAPSELTDPTFKPKACASLDNAEGRCMSTCVGGAIAKQKDRLPTAGCAKDELCAPCYDPVTGEDTGACTINGDKPTLPPYKFPSCCGNGVGVCVTPALAGDQASILRQETCATGRLCAPIKKAKDPKYAFPTCVGAGRGACIPSCIVDPAQAAILGRANCSTGELCAPCSVLGQATGACE